MEVMGLSTPGEPATEPCTGLVVAGFEQRVGAGPSAFSGIGQPPCCPYPMSAPFDGVDGGLGRVRNPQPQTGGGAGWSVGRGLALRGQHVALGRPPSKPPSASVTSSR